MKLKNKLLIIGIVGILFLCGCSDGGKIDTVYSNNKEFTEFDKWLMEDVGVTATPAHIVVKDDKITNVVNETISYKELVELQKESTLNIDISDKLLNGFNLTDYDIIIIKKEDCVACDYQDENFAEEIFEKYKNFNFLIYYIQTEDPCFNGCN